MRLNRTPGPPWTTSSRSWASRRLRGSASAAAIMATDDPAVQEALPAVDVCKDKDNRALVKAMVKDEAQQIVASSCAAAFSFFS